MAVFIDLIYLTLIILPIAFMYATLLVTTCGYSTEELSSLDQVGGQIKSRRMLFSVGIAAHLAMMGAAWL